MSASYLGNRKLQRDLQCNTLKILEDTTTIAIAPIPVGALVDNQEREI
jgi:hypothetical protein